MRCNPVRRNRNIGTAKQGHGHNNRMVIPDSHHDLLIFWEKLNHPIVVPLRIHQKETTLLVEEPRSGFFHACTPDDITTILNLIKPQDLALISTIVLRQPTKKQGLLSPVWGRMAYWADLGPYEGPTVYLEAQTLGSCKWRKALSLESTQELERLKADGHQIECDRRHHIIHFNHSSIRTTQLYRTLPHEIGHAVDYQQKVEGAIGKSELDEDALRAIYWSRPSREREAFAHRYAEEFAQAQQGALPFPQKMEIQKLQAQGLNPNWFTPPY